MEDGPVNEGPTLFPDIPEAVHLKKAFHKYGFKTGFLKLAILRLVAEKPIHGYALIKEIERITSEDWKPSPGSIYPALQTLVKNGLITSEADGRRRIYDITPAGRVVLEAAIKHANIVLEHITILLNYKPSEEVPE
ncbi:MAG TPA: PadR family transcriptional regulator [Methanomassiliicoccales archaeon]|jgi:DNA-binding PadR family transcriptional regulator